MFSRFTNAIIPRPSPIYDINGMSRHRQSGSSSIDVFWTWIVPMCQTQGAERVSDSGRAATAVPAHFSFVLVVCKVLVSRKLYYLKEATRCRVLSLILDILTACTEPRHFLLRIWPKINVSATQISCKRCDEHSRHLEHHLRDLYPGIVCAIPWIVTQSSIYQKKVRVELHIGTQY